MLAATAPAAVVGALATLDFADQCRILSCVQPLTAAWVFTTSSLEEAVLLVSQGGVHGLNHDRLALIMAEMIPPQAASQLALIEPMQAAEILVQMPKPKSLAITQGEAVQVDTITTRVEGAYGSIA